jgi:hypothetical protein
VIDATTETINSNNNILHIRASLLYDTAVKAAVKAATN